MLTRLVRRAEKLVPTIERIRNRSKAVRNRHLEITRAVRSRGEGAKERRERSYRSLLRIVRAVVTDATRVAGKLTDGRVIGHLSWENEVVATALAEDLDMMLPRVEKVIRQTRARICRGINNSPDKLLSLFVPKTAVIRKGKAHKPNEFGRVVDIVEVENGIVSDYQVLEGNPDDGSLLLPAIRRHVKRFGRPPRRVATDRGFWSAKNERAAYAEGVKRVSIPATGKLSRTRLRLERTRWFRQSQRWRAAGEGRIGTLKNVFGMDRCKYKDHSQNDDAAERWVGWCVFANNLVFAARALRRQGWNGQESETTKGQRSRTAA